MHIPAHGFMQFFWAKVGGTTAPAKSRDKEDSYLANINVNTAGLKLQYFKKSALQMFYVEGNAAVRPQECSQCVSLRNTEFEHKKNLLL